MPPATWTPRLRASPALLPLDFDGPEGVGLVELSAADYEAASFLDARMERPIAGCVSYGELAEAAEGLPVACDYIFHIGHVGSTLIARLLGGHETIFCLREPQALRSFAEADLRGAPWEGTEFEARLKVFLALYSRTWGPGERVLVKATSLVGELAPLMLQASAQARALLMTVRPETYLATILGGPNSRRELQTAAPGRRARLARRLDALPVPALSEGELAAMSWASEMTALCAAAAAFRERTSWIDFDAFLADPAAGLAACLRALRGSAEPAEVGKLLASGHLTRYSKAPEHAYGPQLRVEVLAQSRAQAAPEIRRGLAWLEAAAKTAPQIAGALELVGGLAP